MKDGISIGEGLLWVFIWFCFMLFYTFLDVAVWRKITPDHERFLNLITTAVCMAVFFALLYGNGHLQIGPFDGISCQEILIAVGCSLTLFVLLDKCLDPIFEGFFPQSEENYQETIQSLRKAPIISLIQVCILAPVIEEFLMRGFLLSGLAISYGKVTALIISSLLFALLHFNMVQTISALICGLVLGSLYLQTDSLICCITTHMGYNLLSYFAMIFPFRNWKSNKI